MIVVDASVAYKWFAHEDLHGEALRLLGAQQSWLCAPELIVAEVCALAWRNAVRGNIPLAQANSIVERIAAYLPSYYRDHELIGRAFEMAAELHHPLYDCFYLACMEQVDGILVTADRRLTKAVAGSSFADRVHHLASLPANLIAA